VEPTKQELRSGINYINEYVPLANSKNEQYLWTLLQIRDSSSPLHGWLNEPSAFGWRTSCTWHDDPNEFDGTAHWTVYWSITSAFEAIDV